MKTPVDKSHEENTDGQPTAESHKSEKGDPLHPWYYSLSESMTNASIDGMVALDAGYKIIAWNDTAAKWSGHPFPDVIGKYLFDIFPEAQLKEALVTGMKNALRGLKSFLAAGEKFIFPGHFETHVVPLRNWNSEIEGVLLIVHDVAHRVKTENELKELNRALARQNNALREVHEELAAFSKLAAHDLKEPLRKIYTFVELIMMHEAAKLSTSGRTNFRRIQKSVQRMGLLTDDIVNFSELSRSQTIEEVALSKLLDIELEHLQETILETGAQIQVVPLPVIDGFPTALLQIFRQLLSNSLKFRQPDTAPQITIGSDEVDGAQLEQIGGLPERRYYHIWFADNGIGFHPEESNQIFELFHRLHPDGPYRGNGMGLAIARKVMRMHDGFIVAESKPGEGSVFHCYFPIQQDQLN